MDGWMDFEIRVNEEVEESDKWKTGQLLFELKIAMITITSILCLL